ncbi:MAG: ABC transporter ATP-binding protein [Patescibacteria group bacterium]
MEIILKDNRIRTILRLASQAFGKYKKQILVLTILGFIGGILEGIGINAIIPLFSFAIGNGEGGSDFISQAIETFFGHIHVSFNLKYLLIFICSLFVFKALILLYFNYLRIKITADYEERTRNELFQNTLNADWPYLSKQKLGYLENVLMVDVQHSANLLELISNSIMMVTSLSMYILVAINISLYISLITLILGSILFLFFKPLIYKTRVFSYETERMNKTVAHYVNENVLGLKSVKTMHVSDEVFKIGKEYFNKLKNLRIKVFLVSSIHGSLLQPISLIFICVVFALSYKTPGFNFAVLVAVIYLIQKIFTYIQQMQAGLHGFSNAAPYLKSVLNYQEKAKNSKEKIHGQGSFKFNDKLEFREVSFSYYPEKEVLNKIDFSINKGKLVGLIGPSGAGKTTIVDLVLRLFTPNKGTILLDGKDISKISLKEWRKNIGYVSQDIFLTNDTIANNIKFYDESITDDDIKKAAKMANIYNFIASCPDKFSTIIGERGTLISAGQRQRIIIARILARKPKLLILDEATSALDNESEVKIQKVIENLKGKVTVFAIAHRLSTVINSDKLLVIENGRIIEQDTPEKLLKDKKSYFYKVYNIRE